MAHVEKKVTETDWQTQCHLENQGKHGPCWGCAMQHCAEARLPAHSIAMSYTLSYIREATEPFEAPDSSTFPFTLASQLIYCKQLAMQELKAEHLRGVRKTPFN